MIPYYQEPPTVRFETPVWFDNLVYYARDGWSRARHGVPYMQRVCDECGDKRYNHTNGDIRNHPPAPGTDPEYDAGMAQIRAWFDHINDPKDSLLLKHNGVPCGIHDICDGEPGCILYPDGDES